MRQAKRGSAIWRRIGWLAQRVALMGVVALCLAPALAAADELSVFRPASGPAHAIRSLFYLVLGITGGIFLLVEGALIYSAWRYRARRTADQAEPAQVYGTAPLEVAWTVAPLLIVFVLFLVVVRSVVEAQEGNAEGDAMRVRVIGHQWWWEIVYPHENETETVRTANELHVPIASEGGPARIEIELESADVIHSFWVPRLAGKTDMIPGHVNHMWFNCFEPATFLGQCAEYCGTQHANMKLRVVAESPGDFAAWAKNELAPAVADEQAAAGRERFLSLSCVNCHTVRGTTAHGTFGPDLTHLMSRKTIAAGAAENTPEYLRQWIADPDALKPGSKMPNMHLSEADVDLVVDYLETLK